MIATSYNFDKQCHKIYLSATRSVQDTVQKTRHFSLILISVSEFTVQNTGILTMLKDISNTTVLRDVFVAFLMDILVVYSSKMIVCFDFHSYS